jgi:hypothetical protein
LQGDAVFERKKKLDEYYIGLARCQAESATGAGFAVVEMQHSAHEPEKAILDT